MNRSYLSYISQRRVRLITVTGFFTFCFFLVNQIFAQTSNTKNFIRSWVATAPEGDFNLLINKNLTDVKQSTQYLDELGRIVQVVTKSGSLTSGTNRDLVTHIEYDVFGREVYKHLPYMAGTSDGTYKNSASIEQTNFYTGTTSPIQGQGESIFKAIIQYEQSPLNRVQKTLPPGNSWAGSNRGTELTYLTNTIGDDVKTWTITNGAGLGDPGAFSSIPSYHSAGTLYKTLMVNETGRQEVEYRDKYGQVVLKKVQLSDNPSTAHIGWLCTYYLYDDLNNLRLIIQPKGVELLEANGWNINANSGTILNEQCFRYEYDELNRLVVKKLPGTAEIRMVYDRWDRVVLMQDGNFRAQYNWTFTKYDALNRPILSGFHHDPGNITLAQVTMQLKQTESWQIRNESRNSSTTGYTVTQTHPHTAESLVLTSNFYDDYSWVANSGVLITATRNISEDNYLLTPSTVWPYAEPLNQTYSVKGLMTGNRKKILGTENFITSSLIYDEKGRLIQTQSNNITGGLDITTIQYNWSGQPLLIIQKQQIAGTNPQITVVLTKMTYDELGRLLTTEKKVKNSLVNGDVMPGNWVTISKLEYDALGQLKRKSIGNKPNASPGTALAKMDYEYNIHGWLLSINKNYLINSGNNDEYFSMELGYDRNGSVGSFNPQYNGNISGTIWKTAGDGVRRKYDYSYDKLNRLLKADFTQQEGTTWSNSTTNFNVKMGDGIDPTLAYDANGNIKRMQQWGWKINGSTQIDDLSYTYFNNISNKVESVSDNKPEQSLGDFTDKNATGADYGYDLNGNIVTDLNKKISGNTGVNLSSGGGISYNYMNLPQTITVTGNGVITYKYNAEGTKLSKTVVETVATSSYNGQITTTTIYLNGTIYESKQYSPLHPDQILFSNYTNRLQYIQHEQGRIRYELANPNICPAQNNRFVFDYFIKDHLGSIRLILTEQNDQTCYPGATVEMARVTGEKMLYDIVDSRIISKSATDASQVASFESKIYRTHGGLTGEKTGLGIVLKVMAGDIVKIKAESFYTMPTSGPSGTNMILSELLTSFISSGTITAKGNISINDVTNIGVNNTELNEFITSDRPVTTVKAYLNYILFDDQLRYVASGAEAVQTNGGYKLHGLFINSPVSVSKSGYIYIFVSNESNIPVYFDNLFVTHTSGPILGETHYYPFGLALHGISSKAAGNFDNKYKFGGQEKQEKEFSDGSGLEVYDFGARNYDSQIGRWLNVDPMALSRADWSTYNALRNNPISNVDPDGTLDEWVETVDGQMKWDDRVTNQESATKYYGEGSIYRAPGYSYNSTHGRVILGINRQFSQGGICLTAVNSTPDLLSRVGFEIMKWFETTDLVLEGNAKLSVGAQIGVSGNLWGVQGKLEAGVQTFDLFDAAYDVTEMSGHAGASEKRVHNFIGVEGKFFSDKLRVGGRYDYTYQYYNSYSGPKMIDGTGTHDWSGNLPFKNFGPKVKLVDNLISTQTKAGATWQRKDGKNFYGLDVGAGLKLVLGVEVKLKVGFNR